jgi:hypothetical protein
MGDTWAYVYPADPDYVPSPLRVERVKELLAAAVVCQELAVVLSPGRDLIHPMESLESVSCPRCGTTLVDTWCAPDEDDEDDNWWWQQHDRAQTTGYQDLTVTTPCCDLLTDLRSLAYDPTPPAFTRFAIELLDVEHFYDPTVPFTPALMRQLEEALGCEMLQTFMHM